MSKLEKTLLIEEIKKLEKANRKRFIKLSKKAITKQRNYQKPLVQKSKKSFTEDKHYQDKMSAVSSYTIKFY